MPEWAGWASWPVGPNGPWPNFLNKIPNSNLNVISFLNLNQTQKFK
jgi:hypothetical protein